MPTGPQFFQLYSGEGVETLPAICAHVTITASLVDTGDEGMIL